MLTREEIVAAKARAKREAAKDAGRLLARFGASSLDYLNAHADAVRVDLVCHYDDAPVMHLFGHYYGAECVDPRGQVIYTLIPCDTCEACRQRSTFPR